MAVPGAVSDPQAVHGRTVAIPAAKPGLTGYLAEPAAAGPHPAVIVVHEAFGLVEHIRDVARRFANLGYLALAPDLYARVGAPDPAQRDSVFAKMFGLSDDQVVSDLEAASAYLRSHAQASGKVGCIGFCSGGRQTLLVACRSQALDAAVDCWGGFIVRARPDAERTPERPVPVVELVGGLTCPVLAAFGEEDQNPSPEDARRLAEAARRAGKADLLEIRQYANAGHAFFADYRPTYREAAAFALWDDVRRFFARHLQ